MVTPFISLGATDARHYTAISPNVYRFVPMRLQADDLARIHGTNERIAVEDYVGMIRFYIELLRAVMTVLHRRGAKDARIAEEA